MAIALDAGGTGTANAALSTTLTWGAPPVAGALIVGAIAANADGVPFTWPAGFTRLAARDPADAVGSMELWVKPVATGAESPTVITHPSAATAGVVVSFTGASAIRLLSNLIRETLASAAHDAGVFVVGDARERLLIDFVAKTTAGAFTGPGGFTNAGEALNGAGLIAMTARFLIVSAAGNYGNGLTSAGLPDWASFAPTFGPGQGIIAGTPGGGLL